MPKFRIHETHALGQVEAARRIRATIDDFQRDHSNLVDTVSWAADGCSGLAKGRGYTVTFTISESNVEAKVDLGFLLSAFKGKISSKIEEKVTNALNAPA